MYLRIILLNTLALTVFAVSEEPVCICKNTSAPTMSPTASPTPMTCMHVINSGCVEENEQCLEFLNNTACDQTVESIEAVCLNSTVEDEETCNQFVETCCTSPPTSQPTSSPTDVPTALPTLNPTASPTAEPLICNDIPSSGCTLEGQFDGGETDCQSVDSGDLCTQNISTIFATCNSTYSEVNCTDFETSCCSTQPTPEPTASPSISPTDSTSGSNIFALKR